MADVNVSVSQAGRAATSAANYTDSKTAAVSTNTYFVPNNGKVAIVLECTTGGTATIVTHGSVDGLAVSDLTVTTTAAKILIWGGFPPSLYNNSNGNLNITVSAATNLFAFRLS